MTRVNVKLTVMDLRPTTFYQKGEDFKIVGITNTTSVTMGEHLSAEKAESLIMAGWTIIITAFDRRK